MDNEIDIELLDLIRSCENIIKRSRRDISVPKGNGRIMHAISENDGVSQAELAELLDIRPQSLTRVLLQLEEDGYIERKRSSSDGRALSVFITEKGADYHKMLRENRKERAHRIFSSLTGEEKGSLVKALRKVIIENTKEDKA